MKKTSSIAIASLLLFSLGVGVSAQNDKGKMTSQEHRSKVAEVVQVLTELAGKDQNIGEEVRLIAQEQKESNDRATAAMEAVETRGKFRTFLFGTDYKNVGVIRSELVKTDNHINRLTKAKDRTEDEGIRTELDTQIANLRETKSQTEFFVQENESKFSLFGWLVRLFN